MTSLIQTFIIVLLGILWLILLRVSIKKPVFFIGIILTYLGITSTTAPWMKFLEFQFESFGFSVYPLDIFSLSALTALFISTFQKKNAIEIHFIATIKFISVLLLCLVLTGIITWVSTYGVPGAVNAWRELLYSFIFLVYGLKNIESWNYNSLYKVLVVPGLILVIISLFRFLQVGVGYSSRVDPITGLEISRVTTASGAYLILLSIMAFYFFSNSRSLVRVLITLFGLIVILFLQHRTIWISAAVSAGTIAVMDDRNNSKFGRLTKIPLVLTSSFLALFAVLTVAELSDAAKNTQTLSWRMSRWNQSMSTPRSTAEWIFGSLFGPTAVTELEFRTRLSHSAYVNQIEFLGYFGLGLMICLLIVIFLHLRINVKENVFGVAFLTGLATYGYSYSFSLVAFCLLPAIIGAGLNSFKLSKPHNSKMRTSSLERHENGQC